MSDIKKLLGESVSEDTANALQAIIDTTVNENNDKLTKLQEEKDALVEAMNALETKHASDIEYLKEKADEFAEQIRQDAIDETNEAFAKREEFLIEQAEAYGEFLMGKADEYGDYLQERAEAYGEHLIERGEAYGEHLIERAEAYGEHLIEQADVYGEQIEAKCLEEAKEQIESFKAEHLELFEQLDEQSRIKHVFDNLKTLIESSGFTLEESSAIDEAKEKIRSQRRENRKLEAKLSEQAEEIKELRIEKLVESIGEDLAFTDKERIKKAALFTRCDESEDLEQVVKTLVENTLLNNSNKPNMFDKKQNVIKESETKDLNRKTSGWKDRLI